MFLHCNYCILIHRYNIFLDCAIIQLSELLRHRQSQIDAHVNNGSDRWNEDGSIWWCVCININGTTTVSIEFNLLHCLWIVTNIAFLVVIQYAAAILCYLLSFELCLKSASSNSNTSGKVVSLRVRWDHCVQRLLDYWICVSDICFPGVVELLKVDYLVC